MIPWEEVARNPVFQKLSPEDKRAARDQYFEEVVVPQVRPEQIDAARAQFLQTTMPDITGLDPTTGRGEYLLERTKRGVIGGLINIPGYLADISQLPARGLGRLGVPGLEKAGKEPFMGATAKTQAFGQRLLGSDPEMRPPTEGTRLAGGIAEFAGAGAAPSTAIVRSAAHRVPALISEIASTVGGGLGQEIAGVPGGLVGGIGLGVTAPAVASKLYSHAAPAAKSFFGRSKPEALAGREIMSSLEAQPGSGLNLQHADEVTDELRRVGAGEFQPTLGGRSGAEGIISREHQIAASTPSDLGRYAERHAQNLGVVERGEQLMFPPAAGTPQGAARTVAVSTTRKLEERLANVQGQREQLTRDVKTQPQQQAGQQLDKLRSQEHAIAREIKNKKINDVYKTADELGVQEDMTDVVNLVQQMGRADPNLFQKMPPVFGRVVTEFAEEPTASFRALHSLWKETNSQYGAALRSGDSTAQFYLQKLKEALSQKVSKYEGPEFGRLAEKFGDFNKFYSTKYAPAFKEGVGGRMAATGRYGDILKPEKVVGEFFTPSGIDDFNLIYGTNAKAQETLRDGVLGLFKARVVKGGVIDERAAERFVARHAETLEKVPDIATVLTNTRAADTALIEAGKRTLQQQKQFDQSFLANLAKTENPNGLIDAALADSKMLRSLGALGRSPQDKAVIARAIADRIPAVAQRHGVDPLTYVLQNRTMLRPVLDRLGPDHMKNLQTIAGAKTILGRTIPPRTVKPQQTDDPLQEVTGTSIQSLMNMLRVVYVTRAAGEHGMATVLAGKFWNRRRAKAAEKLTREAIYSPEIARDLAAAVGAGEKITAPVANNVRNHVYSLGLKLAFTEPDEE